MTEDAQPPATTPSRKLISELDEFWPARWHTGWTLLNQRNPGLAFAAAMLIPWHADGYHALYRDLDQGLDCSELELLGRTGLPTDERTLRILGRFNRVWWSSFEEGENARCILRILGSLLRYEPDTDRLMSRQDQLTPDDVVDLACGLEISEWVWSVLFRSDLIGQAEWFFRLPYSRRCWLARTLWDLHGRNVGDFVTETAARERHPNHPHLDSFRDEDHAVAYTIRLRADRARMVETCVNVGRFAPWPEHPFPGTEWIVPIRNHAEAYPESRCSDFAMIEPKISRFIALGRSCLYRMLKPIRALVVLAYPHEPDRQVYRARWELGYLIPWPNENSESRCLLAKARIERWLEQQSEESRQSPAVSRLTSNFLPL